MASPSQSPARDDDTAGRTAAVPRTGFLRSFSFAGQGVWYVIRTQRNMRVHLAAAACAIAAGLALRVSPADWACVIITIAVVLAVETLNTVVEALTDLCTNEFHPLAKIAKDAAAGAVLIVSVAAVSVAIVIFLPRFFALVR
jgi:diacylglycerol kinase (ATP)